jgi:hypothetical protein
VLHSIDKIEWMRRSDGALDCAIRGLMDDNALLVSLTNESFRLKV